MQAARTSARQLLRSSSSIIHPSRRAIHSSASTSSALLSSPPSCHHPTCGFHASSRVAAVYSNSNDIYHLQPRPHYMSNHNATQQQLRYASKKKHSKGQHKKSSQNNKEEEEDDDDEIQVEDHPVPVLAKGKKARAAQMKATAAEDEAVEAFHLDKLEKLMDDAVEKFSRDVRSVVGRVERLSPGGSRESATISIVSRQNHSAKLASLHTNTVLLLCLILHSPAGWYKSPRTW